MPKKNLHSWKQGKKLLHESRYVFKNGKSPEEIETPFGLTEPIEDTDLHRKQVEKLLSERDERTLTDKLTGLPKREIFDKKLDEKINEVKREGKLSLVLFDIDHFKEINDTFGHDEGDEVLEKMGKEIKVFLKRSTDIAARYGGEEFVLILPATDEEGAKKVAEDLVKHIESTVKKPNGGTVTISAGYAEFDRENLDQGKKLIKAADEALYAAKNRGRNQAVGYNEVAETVAVKPAEELSPMEKLELELKDIKELYENQKKAVEIAKRIGDDKILQGTLKQYEEIKKRLQEIEAEIEESAISAAS